MNYARRLLVVLLGAFFPVVAAVHATEGWRVDPVVLPGDVIAGETIVSVFQ